MNFQDFPKDFLLISYEFLKTCLGIPKDFVIISHGRHVPSVAKMFSKRLIASPWGGGGNMRGLSNILLRTS